MTRVSVSPEAGTQTVLGKEVSDLQSNVSITNNVFSGVLPYVTGYTQFSGEPELQEGHYLAIKFTADWSDYTSVKVGIVPSSIGAEPSEILEDPDKNMVARITDKENQNIVVIATDGENTITQYYGLRGLVLEPKE